NTKSSRSFSRDALNPRTMGPMRRTFGQSGADSAASTRSALCAIREAQKFAGPSTKRDNGSRAKSWRVASRMKAVGIRSRNASGGGPRSGRVAEALGMDREVPTEFLHRATHRPLPQRPSDGTSAFPGSDPFRGPARAAYGRGYIAGGS